MSLRYRRLMSSYKKAGGIVPGTVLLFDEFTDDNNTSLDAHTISPTNLVGASWVNYGNELEVISNRPTPKLAGISYALCDTTYADCKITAIIKSWGSAGWNRKPLIYLRAGNYIVGINEDTNKIAILDSAKAELAFKDVTINESQEYEVEVILNGQTISAKVGETTVEYNTASSGVTETTHGVYLYYIQAYADYGIEDFKVIAT